MTSCPEEMVLRIWGFWKTGSWDWTFETRVGDLVVVSWILTVERYCWVFRISTDRDLKDHNMHRTLGWGLHRLLRIVYLTSCRHGPKLGVNKPVLTWNDSVCLYLYHSSDWYHYDYGYSTQSQILKQSLTGFNSDMSFFLNSLLYHCLRT